MGKKPNAEEGTQRWEKENAWASKISPPSLYIYNSFSIEFNFSSCEEHIDGEIVIVASEEPLKGSSKVIDVTLYSKRKDVWWYTLEIVQSKSSTSTVPHRG